MKLMLNMFMKIFTKTNNHLNSAIIQNNSNHYDKKNNLFVCKMKDEVCDMPKNVNLYNRIPSWI